jgi:hypothetical protein
MCAVVVTASRGVWPAMGSRKSPVIRVPEFAQPSRVNFGVISGGAPKVTVLKVLRLVLWGTWETPRTYYGDDITVHLTPD